LILRHGDDADAKGQKKGNVFFHGPNVNQAIEWTLRKIASEGVVYYGKSQKQCLRLLVHHLFEVVFKLVSGECKCWIGL
jgi:hypothetical protein